MAYGYVHDTQCTIPHVPCSECHTRALVYCRRQRYEEFSLHQPPRQTPDKFCLLIQSSKHQDDQALNPTQKRSKAQRLILCNSVPGLDACAYTVSYCSHVYYSNFSFARLTAFSLKYKLHLSNTCIFLLKGTSQSDHSRLHIQKIFYRQVLPLCLMLR